MRALMLRVGPHTRSLLREAPVAFGLKVMGAGLAFGLNIVLARTLGAQGVGVFILAVTVVTVAGVVGRIGLDHALVRHVATGVAARDPTAVATAHLAGIGRSTIAAAAIALLLGFTGPWLGARFFGEPALGGHLRLMALAVVPATLFVLYAQLLKGHGRVPASLLLQGSVLPALATVGVALLAPVAGVTGAVLAYVVACWLTLAFGSLLWRRTTSYLRDVAGRWDAPQLLASSRPLFWSSLFNLVVLWSSTLMLGTLATSTDVGLFGIASRTAMLISFVLVAVNSVTAPKFAALHARGDTISLGATARSSARLMALAAAPLLLLAVALPGVVLSLFGPEFAPAGRLLQVLAVAQYVNVVTGSVGILLMMCGQERTMRDIMAGSAAVILVLNALLIPALGAMGAALAYATVLILQNVAATIQVWRHLGIRPFLAGGIGRSTP